MIVDFSLKGKVAIVTGASRGIGASLAKALAEYGAEVVITNKTMEGLMEVEEAIKAAGGKAVSKAVTMEYWPRSKTCSNLLSQPLAGLIFW